MEQRYQQTQSVRHVAAASLSEHTQGESRDRTQHKTYASWGWKGDTFVSFAR